MLTFFNGRCNDICPVLAAEISQADVDLGAEATRVSFLTVNTDPMSAAVADLVRRGHTDRDSAAFPTGTCLQAARRAQHGLAGHTEWS